MVVTEDGAQSFQQKEEGSGLGWSQKEETGKAQVPMAF